MMQQQFIMNYSIFECSPEKLPKQPAKLDMQQWKDIAKDI